MAKKSSSSDELLAKLGGKAGYEGRGWGGCMCPCHRGLATHIRACCHPSREELDRIMKVLCEDGDAQRLITAVIGSFVTGNGAGLDVLGSRLVDRINSIKRLSY